MMMAAAGITPGVWTVGNGPVTSTGRCGGFGLQGAGVRFGGYDAPTYFDDTEEYDGLCWTAVNNLLRTLHSGVGIGIISAGLCVGGTKAGGDATDETEEYNGTCWSVGGVLSAAITFYGGSGCGTQSAGLVTGGENNQGTFEYDGSSWAAGGACLNAVAYPAVAGTQTSGLKFGGAGPVADTEEYDGTCWSVGGNLATAVYAPSGCGTQTAALKMGGATAYTVTEAYNGTAWAARGSLNNNHTFPGFGIQAAALAVESNATEEYVE